MKERVEDLGRIAAYLEKIMYNELFENCNKPFKTKYTAEWIEEYFKKGKPDLEEYLENIFYNIRLIEDDLYNILSIANGNYMEE